MHWLNQLRKEGRRNEYERRKLQALNQRQKMVECFSEGSPLYAFFFLSSC